ncbi:tripartite tricarboxylate transporter substrate binding protein [Salibacterium aidingense]|uniref:tripartite tricarboxylate transporter substrate binding protein n=1 Tax=Salibacterium aidingense TaxID=384933 RepID=UPI0003FDD1A1|nr:tripartite tricarboxylate transporter substrate binding protein [Salibacterium aidingense]
MLEVKFLKKGSAALFLLALIFVIAACGNQPSSEETGDTGGENTSNEEAGEAEGSNDGSDYPTEQIEVLIGFDPGGGSDQLAQVTQPHLKNHLDGSFVNEYKPGASGGVAWTELANNIESDGYTISITNSPQVLTNYMVNPELQYSLSDFDPIANVVTDPAIIVVSGDSEFSSYEDFANYLEENPEGLNVSHSGVGGDDFFSLLRWSRASNLDVEMIPFDGDGPSWQAAAGGDVDASFNNLGVVYSQIQEGNLKALAVASDERSDMLPDVPTLKELDVDVVAGSSRGYSAPKGIPEEAKKELYDAFEQLREDEEFKTALEEAGLPMNIMTGEEYAEFLEQEEESSSEIWEEVKGEYE